MKNHLPPRPSAALRFLPLAFALGLASPAATAGEFQLGDGVIQVRGITTLGAGWRVSGRDPSLIPPQNARVLGIEGAAVAGPNSDDGNLNYDRGDRVATVLKALVDVEAKFGPTRGFLRARGWTDHTLEHQGARWGNLPNGYVANQPLSDREFNRLARFSGATVMDAFLEHSFGADAGSLVRLGNQSIPWGVPASTRGGLDQVNAQDLAARFRPGAALDEAWQGALPGGVAPPSSPSPRAVFDIPTLAAFSRIALSPHLVAEAFHQFRFEPSQLPGGGTFGSFADYLTEGCEKVLVGSGSDAQSVATGMFGTRAPDLEPGHGGQYGLGLHYTNPSIGRFGIYFANIHSRRFAIGGIKSTRPAPAPPFIPGNPGGANVRYFLGYPPDLRIYALNYLARTETGSGAFAELSHQPNQVMRLNATDLINAFASNVAPTIVRGDATAVAPGGIYQGWDRLKVTQFTAGGRLAFAALRGARWLQLEGEVAAKYVHDLPDPSVRRYGRSDIFGVGPVNGVCFGPPSQCTNDGFVTPLSWGYRVRASARLPSKVAGLRLASGLTYAHNVKGWSHDEIFNEKRQYATFALRASYGASWQGELEWTAQWGGTYNVAKDRDLFTASLGRSF